MNSIAEVFPPGEFLKEELEARGWSQTALAEIMGRPVRLINEIIAGKKGITPETAIQLGESLGTGPELWMNLESQYQLSKVRSTDGLIRRRAKLYEGFPVREMMKRGWLEASKSIEVVEQQLRDFFRLGSVDDDVHFCHAARKTEAESAPTMQQLAWLFRARQLADELVGPAFEASTAAALLKKLEPLRSAPEETRHVARCLAEHGIRFVVVEPIPGTKIDGACFWLDRTRPAIALSLRLDRIDNFWFVLRHELEHVFQGHGRDSFILDQDLESAAPVSEEERIANAAGSAFGVSDADMRDFIARVNPFFSEERVVLFARRLGVHPGLVVGQLQHRLDRYDLLRKHQVKVRSFVTATARTDGWGAVVTN